MADSPVTIEEPFNHLHIKNKYLVVIFSFGPPLVIGMIYPDIFLQSLDVVGGVGIVVLFGILPSIIAIMKAKRLFTRILCLLIFLLFVGFLGLEIMQECGVLNIHPDVEHWETMQSLFKEALSKGN